LTTVVIIGRPNVGKSTLFNKIVGRRKALVHNEPGVTRDLNYEEVEYEGKNFLLVDTGGIVGATEDPLKDLVSEQAEIAIEQSDLIIFLVDSQDGIVPVEYELAEKLRKSKKKILLAVNKIDDEKHKLRETEFYSLGITPLISISAEHGYGVYDLLDEIKKEIPDEIEEKKEEGAIRISIVGKPNVGKSSTLNRIVGKNRVLVSPIPGTTRDPIDVPLSKDGINFLLMDTAGIKKRSKTERGAEILSMILATKSLEKSDVALFVVDASNEPTHQDAHIASLIESSRKSALVLLNKWDLVDEKQRKEREEVFYEKFSFIPYFEFVKVSAKSGKGFNNILDKVNQIYENYSKKVATSELNRVLNHAIKRVSPPVVEGKEFKIKYATQVGTKPPRFMLFTNSDSNPPESYIRYLKNFFYESLNLSGSPITIIFRRK
jgi:GTP-binding protein